MEELKQKRQLAAIMFTDIVGYTTLMGEDEDLAFRLLRKNRELHKLFISEHNGLFLKEMGDGILSSFPTVSDAVYCSLAIQFKVKEEADYSLRIGIHSGEVVFENGDVYGDGVNLASRIADNAKEGHVLVSETVYRDVLNKKGISGKLLDRTTLKNVKEPINIYWIRDDSDKSTPGKQEIRRLSFRKELKRRNVPQVLLAYVAASLLLLQLTRVSFPLWTLPGWTFQALIISLIIGFPCATILAWMFERSPSGVIRTASNYSLTNPYSSNQRKPLTSNWAISMLLLVIVLSYFFPMNIMNRLGIQTGLSNPTVPEIHNNFIHLTQFTYNDKLASAPSWSPDGEWLVYSSNESGSTDLWKKKINEGEAIQLTTSRFPDQSPAWAPDNRSIIFERGGSVKGLYQISINGGKAAKLIDFGSHPSWSPDGSKLVFDWHGSIFTYDINSYKIDTIIGELSNPPPFAIWMPDNERIIYWNSVVGKIFIVSASTKEKIMLELIPSGEEVNGLSLSKNGSKLIYSRGAFGGIKSLWEVDFDLESGAIISSPKSIRLSITGDIECALSPDGTKLAFTARNINRQLYRIPLDIKTGINFSKREQLTYKGNLNYYPSVTLNESKLLLTSHIGGNGLLYSMDLDTKLIEKVTEEWGDSTREVEASMGKNGYPIYYSSTVNNSYELFKQEARGSFPTRLNNPDSTRYFIAPAISPDEKSIIYYVTEGGTFSIAKMGVNKGDPEQRLTPLMSNETRPVWSPDGIDIAYLSDVNGNYKLWKMRADGINQHEIKLPAASEHGWCDWSPDGKWFYYTAKVYDFLNIYRVNADYKINDEGSSWLPVTTFQSSDFGLPDQIGFTKFEITNNNLIVPLEKRSGEIYILSK